MNPAANRKDIMQLNVLQCDVCRCEGRTDDGPPPGWSKFSTAFDGVASHDVDLCPDCRAKVQLAIERALAPGPVVPVGGLVCLETLARTTERHILAVLTATDWNKFRAAKILDIERSTLDRKLKRYRASRPVPVEPAAPVDAVPAESVPTVN